jgi:integrase
MSPKVLWDVVRAAAARAGIDKLAPHDLRRTWARLCHVAGGELDQIQFLLGHVSMQTTERLPWMQAKAPDRGKRPIGNRA